MAAEPLRRGRENGFTLIEVLIAMVILAVGLLALQGLSVGVARSVVRADRESEMAVAASERLERTVQTLRANNLALACAPASPAEGPGFSTTCRVAQLNPRTRRVVVTATPVAGFGGINNLQPITLTTDVFR